MTASMASSSQSVLSQRNVPFGASTSDFSLSGEMPLDPTYNTIGLVSGRGDDDEGGKKKRVRLFFYLTPLFSPLPPIHISVLEPKNTPFSFLLSPLLSLNLRNL